ncbi:lysosomal-associated transmembrane protein 4A-like [Lineus longissimus]|uniref:lysosomal-associated transmembrane protein 4A-like n=1 Tax=Lineus longissimus TaxID=88925 RepID=UPI002B4C258C
MRFTAPEKNNPNMYRCCFCVHVRTGAILLGLWHMAMHLIVLSLFGVMMIHPEILQSNRTVAVTSDTVNIYLNEYDKNDDAYMNWFQDRKWTTEDKYVGLLITLCSFLLTALLVYGALKAKPGYLMPFFCLQVFDFCITCLSVVCYFSYMPNIKQWIREQDNLPFKEELLNFDAQWLMLIVIMVFVLLMSMKAYFIGVVWACYKYLSRRNIEQAVTTYMDGEHGTDSEMLLPPKYEDAIKYPVQMSHLPPPPPYTAAN